MFQSTDTGALVVPSAFAGAGRRLHLPGGRRLGYLDYGDPEGEPVFLFHGLPGSRLQRHPDVVIAESLGARLIAMDRPGYGLSDFQPNRTLLDWPADVAALADRLGIDRFAVLGVSGGGPYAAACAVRLSHRLTRVGMVSSMGYGRWHDMWWGHRLLLRLASLGGWPVRLPAAVIAALARYWPQRYLENLNARLPAVDRALFNHPAVRAMFQEDIAAAFGRGPLGAVRDIVLLTRPWGFHPADIRVPVQLWHGDQDATVPVRMGRELAAAIPRCQARFFPDAGHLLVIRHWREILTRLLH